MNCPHCDHPKSTVSETRAGPKGDRRIRICRNCGQHFSTMERVCVYAGRVAGYLEVTDDEPEPATRAPAIIKQAKFRASIDMPELKTIEESCRIDMVRWWNESRLSKHKSKAVWTYNAFMGSVKRLAVLPHWKQVILVKAGIEQGWQTLNWDYCADRVKSPPAEAGLQPKSSAYQEAAEKWHMQNK